MRRNRYIYNEDQKAVKIHKTVTGDKWTMSTFFSTSHFQITPKKKETGEKQLKPDCAAKLPLHALLLFSCYGHGQSWSCYREDSVMLSSTTVTRTLINNNWPFSHLDWRNKWCLHAIHGVTVEITDDGWRVTFPAECALKTTRQAQIYTYYCALLHFVAFAYRKWHLNHLLFCMLMRLKKKRSPICVGKCVFFQQHSGETFTFFARSCVCRDCVHAGGSGSWSLVIHDSQEGLCGSCSGSGRPVTVQMHTTDNRCPSCRLQSSSSSCQISGDIAGVLLTRYLHMDWQGQKKGRRVNKQDGWMNG